MDQTPLVNDLIESGMLFLAEFAKSYPVGAAFWLKANDDRKWRLHIASPTLQDGRKRDAYGEVIRITDQMKDVFFDPFNVILRKMDDDIVKFALSYKRIFPTRGATIYDVPSYYGEEVEGMYLYPPIKAAA